MIPSSSQRPLTLPEQAVRHWEHMPSRVPRSRRRSNPGAAGLL